MQVSKNFILLITLFLAACGSKDNTIEKTAPPEIKKEKTEVPATAPAAGADSDGKTLFNTCIPCHGEQAQGIPSMNAPGLVNQETWYLERQLQNFQEGIRGSDPKDVYGLQMSPMAKTLNGPEAISKVIAYIKTFPEAKTKKTIKGNVENGKDYYNMVCGACHGPAGVGNKALNAPKLVDIDDWYLERQFLNFKNEIRGMHPDDEFGFQMQQMSSVLPTEQDIKDVIAFLTSLE